MRRPLPDFEEEVDIEEGLGQPSGDEDLPQEPEQIGPEFDESFQLQDADNLRRVIGDMCAATPPVLSVTHQLSVRRRDTHRAKHDGCQLRYCTQCLSWKTSHPVTSHCQGRPHQRFVS